MKRIAGILGLLLLTACATQHLTASGAAVRITINPEVVKGCKFVGDVHGSDHWNGGLVGQGVAEDDARTEAQNKAAEMGGNVVLIQKSDTNRSGAEFRGEAYLCPSVPGNS